MIAFLISLGLLIGGIIRGYFLYQNNVVTNADSFAYLQMSHYLNQFDIQGFGTGWFGFLYSACISIPDFLIKNSFISAQIINFLLFFVGGVALYAIAQRYLHYLYNWLLMILYGTSTALLYYGTNILSENLYIPLFLLFFLYGIRYLESDAPSQLFWAGIFLGLMYITRAEAFIYGAPLALLVFIYAVARKIEIQKVLLSYLVLGLGFFLLAGPYMYYLHSITGEWGLTNKGASNIRQAMMRGVETMDDEGFEKAVGELTDDKTKLKSGFVGGMAYQKAEGNYSLKQLIEQDKKVFLDRWQKNITKLGSETLPKMIVGEGLRYYSESSSKWYHNIFLLILLLIPLALSLYGFLMLYLDRRRFFVYHFLLMFATASIFFTMFFVLERYFITFLPLILLCMVYGAQSLLRSVESLQIPRWLVLSIILIGINGLGLRYVHDHENDIEAKYLIKKEVGQRLKENRKNVFLDKENIRIMERFPIVTYYAGVWERWITPYATQSDLIAYAKANDIDLLVVDTLDFATYRPELTMLLDPSPDNALRSKVLVPVVFGKRKKEQQAFYEKYGQRIVLYKFNF